MQKVKYFYNQSSYPDTKQYTNKQKKQTKKILQKILYLADIDLLSLKNKRILVAGCGTGEKVDVLSRNNLSIVAIDFSEKQLQKAKALVKNKNVSFLKKDIVNDDLSSLGVFDVILCLGVLHHTEAPEKGFSKLSGLLKKEGIIFVGLYHKYARLRYRIIRKLLRLLVSKKQENLKKWIQKNQDRKFFLKASLPCLLDRYVVPYESYHTLRQVKKWFRKNNIVFLKNTQNVSGFEMLKIFEKKTIFFVSGKKEKNR